MKALAAWAALSLLLAGCALQPASRPASAAFDVRQEPARYIIVNVRNPRGPLLPLAGSTVRDYGSTASYSATPVTRRTVRAIAASYGLDGVDAWPIPALGIHCVVFRVPDAMPAGAVLRRLAHDARVESAQLMNSFATQTTVSPATSDDPYRSLQRNLDTLQVAQAHTWSRGADVRIAVIDTGVDVRHPDLAGRIAGVRNFVDDADAAKSRERHGTAVAGLIAAVDNNHEGISGIAPAAQLYALKACWPEAPDGAKALCNTLTLAKAIAAAIDARLDIVNLSLAGPPDPLLARLVDHGTRRGVIFVGAAAPAGARGFPCDAAAVICVDAAGTLTAASVDAPTIFAPGTDVLTLVPGGRYDFLSGSSLAAATISGGIALLRARQPRLTSADAQRLLSRSAMSPAGHAGAAASVNLCTALTMLLHAGSCADPEAETTASDH